VWILFVACLLRGLVIFDEPGFPAVDVSSPLPSIAEAARATSVAELERALGEPGTVLVWRHGSAYPAEAWGAIVRFLEGGGSMLVLGGEPFTRHASGDGRGWRTRRRAPVDLVLEGASPQPVRAGGCRGGDAAVARRGTRR